MCEFKYMRYCPFCKENKPYPSTNSKNNKARCPDCADEYHKTLKKPYKCNYCKKARFNKVRDFFDHLLGCEDFLK